MAAMTTQLVLIQMVPILALVISDTPGMVLLAIVSLLFISRVSLYENIITVDDDLCYLMSGAILGVDFIGALESKGIANLTFLFYNYAMNQETKISCSILFDYLFK